MKNARTLFLAVLLDGMISMGPMFPAVRSGFVSAYECSLQDR